MKHKLSDRHCDILDILISDYIASAHPVGSRTIAKKYSGHLSPATIRNVMADLTEMGLLNQPHTSAGRIPTREGMRLRIRNKGNRDAYSGEPGDLYLRVQIR